MHFSTMAIATPDALCPSFVGILQEQEQESKRERAIAVSVTNAIKPFRFGWFFNVHIFCCCPWLRPALFLYKFRAMEHPTLACFCYFIDDHNVSLSVVYSFTFSFIFQFHCDTHLTLVSQHQIDCTSTYIVAKEFSDFSSSVFSLFCLRRHLSTWMTWFRMKF